MASSSSYSSPCAACKFLRRKCLPGCVFAPYFPPEEPQKFANVHKIFGASNVTKLLNEILPHQREDAVNSLAYEAEARIRDPVFGCTGAISFFQRQVQRLQRELDAANADLIRYSCFGIPPNFQIQREVAFVQQMSSRMKQFEFNRMASSGTGGMNENPNSFPVNYSLPWSENSSGHINGGGADGLTERRKPF